MIPSDTPRTLQALLQRRLETAPEGRAIAWLDARGGFSWLSFGELHRRASGYGAALERLGLRRGGACVIVEVDPELASCVVLGTLLRGGLPLLVAPPTIQGTNSVLGDVVKHVVGRTGAHVVVAADDLRGLEQELAHTAPQARVAFGREGVAPEEGAALAPVLPAEDDVAAYQLTSGTTGFPRICTWRQQNVVAALAGMEKAMRLSAADVYLNWTPLYHDMGLVNNLLLCLSAGIPLALQSPLDFIKKPALWLRGLHATGATHTWSPNFGFAVAVQRIRDREVEGVQLAHVRGFWNAAERIHLETMEAFFARFAPLGVTRAALKTNFGCVENVGGATFSAPDESFVYERVDQQLLQHERIARVLDESDSTTPAAVIVSAGRPHPDMDVHVLGEDGERLPDGRVGEVALLSPSRMAGFLGEPEETRRTLRGPYAMTGDLGYRRGSEFFWVGRLREKINLHGKKFDPSDFERPLLEVPDLREGCFAAFGVDDVAAGSQALVLVCEVREAATREWKEICDDVRARVAQQLGVRARDVILVGKGNLTKTSSGKRRHTFFREQYLAGQLVPLYESHGRTLRH